MTSLSGTFSNIRYVPAAKDTWVLNPAEDLASVTLSMNVDVSKTAAVDVYLAHCADTMSVPALDPANIVYSGSAIDSQDVYLRLDPAAVTTDGDSANCVVVQMVTDSLDLVGTGFTCSYTATPFVSTGTLVALPPLAPGQKGTLTSASAYNGQDSLSYYVDDHMHTARLSCSGVLAGDGTTEGRDYFRMGRAFCSPDGTVSRKVESRYDYGPVTVNFDQDIYTEIHEGYNCWYFEYIANTKHIGSQGISCDYTVSDYDSQTQLMMEPEDTFANSRYISYQYDQWVVYPRDMLSAELECQGSLADDDFITVRSAVCETHKDGSITPSEYEAKAQQNGSRIKISETLEFDPAYTAQNCFVVALETNAVDEFGSKSISCSYTATLPTSGGMPWWGVTLIVLGVLILLGGVGYFVLWPRYGHKLTGKLDLEAGQEDLPIMSGIDAKEDGDGAYGSGEPQESV
ncbi:hypothetical protein KIPB_004134 [Kipferlia bialata]|uniref:Uncharacterized protein n=1 Tax=Kipferlia bialata TaxID=797122 RepID=A0A9K3CUZ1_9EUKA|nr:hypothetical protein KIPB_004134 [Kipferlia bialata]|eukprot:g4134.t1